MLTVYVQKLQCTFLRAYSPLLSTCNAYIMLASYGVYKRTNVSGNMYDIPVRTCTFILSSYMYQLGLENDDVKC